MSCFIIKDTYTHCSGSAEFEPLFLVNIFKDLDFETNHYGIKCVISTVSIIRVTAVGTWSTFEGIIGYLKDMEIDNEKCFLQEHASAVAPVVTGENV